MASYARRGCLIDERDGMSVAELQELEEVKLLITKGQTTGVLTYAEVATALAEVDLDESDIEDLHGFLERSEIELVEEIDQPQVPAAAAEAERETGGRRRKAETQPGLRPGMTTDSPPLFLKGNGKGPPPTPPGEGGPPQRTQGGG